MRRLAVRDDMAYDRLDGVYHFDLQAAARLPRPAFAPFELAVDLRELAAPPPIGEDLPRGSPAGFGSHTILKTKHNPSRHSILSACLGIPKRAFGAYSLYTVSLTM